MIQQIQIKNIKLHIVTDIKNKNNADDVVNETCPAFEESCLAVVEFTHDYVGVCLIITQIYPHFQTFLTLKLAIRPKH